MPQLFSYFRYLFAVFVCVCVWKTINRLNNKTISYIFPLLTCLHFFPSHLTECFWFLSVFVVFISAWVYVFVCVVKYIERCILDVCLLLCVYIDFYIILPLKTIHSPMRSRVTLYHFVCLCMCLMRAGFFACGSTCFLSLFYHFRLVSVFCFVFFVCVFSLYDALKIHLSWFPWWCRWWSRFFGNVLIYWWRIVQVSHSPR